MFTTIHTIRQIALNRLEMCFRNDLKVVSLHTRQSSFNKHRLKICVVTHLAQLSKYRLKI